MAKGEIIINNSTCKGCGYCVKFCTRGCITQPGDLISSQGYVLPAFSNPARCNACAVCAWMCPENSIEVFVEVAASDASKV